MKEPNFITIILARNSIIIHHVTVYAEKFQHPALILHHSPIILSHFFLSIAMFFASWYVIFKSFSFTGTMNCALARTEFDLFLSDLLEIAHF